MLEFSKNITKIILWLSGIGISLIVIIFPLFYFIVSYQYVTGSLETEAEINAYIITQIISTNPKMWEFEQIRLKEYLSQRPRKGHAETRRIFNAKNELIAESADMLNHPIIRRSSDLFDSGVAVGRIEISRSFNPLLKKTGLFALLGASIGALLFTALRILQIRAIQQAEEARRESAETLKRMLDSVHAGIVVIDPEKHEIIDVNAYALQMANASREQIVGHICHDLICPAEVGKCPITDLQQKVDNSERALLTTDKRKVPILKSVVPVMYKGREHLLESFIDIIDIKQAEEALKSSEAQFRRLSQEFNALLDAIPDNLTLLSHDLKVLWANRGAAKGLGKEIPDLVGHYCYRLWHNRTVPCGMCPVLRTFHTGQPEIEQVTSPDNKTWELRTIPIKDDNGRVANVIEVGRDITEHRKLEDQYRQAQKMEAVGQLAGGIAHDFNNILTAIIGYGNILKMKMKEDTPLKVYIDHILSASDRAANLTQSLLAFSRKQISNPMPINLNEIIKEVEKLLIRIIGEHIELRTMLADKDLIVMADSGQIEQALMNLAANARDAMPDGGLLTIETGTVELDNEFIKMQGYRKKGMYAVMSVTDSGIGIDEKTREKIFEPFFTTKEVGKGTGLGLAMVYGIIKQHNGYINVYSEVGKGTTFKIYLPMIKVEIKKEKDVAVAPVTGGTEAILLAEDEKDVRDLMKEALEEFGYFVVEAKDGQEAVEKFTDYKDKIQLLLFDVIMPRMNGREAYERIKKIKPDIKTLFASGYPDEFIHRKEILEQRLNFVSKPISPTALLKKVREVLDSLS